MPSSGRTAEQVHGGNRDSIGGKGVLLDFTDAQPGHVANEEHVPWSQRRKIEQMKSTKETVKGVVKRAKAVGGINHDNRKCLQQMVGDQVLEQISKHSSRKLKAELLKEAASVKNMKKKGALASNKAPAKRNAEMASKKLKQSTGR
jgi:hypothetical protein